MSLRTLLIGLMLLLPITGVYSTESTASSGTDPASTGIEQPGVQSALVGRNWQLVEILSMDDRVDKPEDRSLYTLELKADGTVLVRADCNRGSGSWTSSAPGKLEFGPIASTRAQCPPGSLHDRYLAQFVWIRSYIVKNGHLFLATMADGSIIEFEPVQLPIVATVLDEEVRTDDPGEMQEFILSRLFDRYAEQQGIEVTDAELDAYLESTRRGMRARGLTAENELTPEEAAEAEQMRRNMGRSMIHQWELNRALYRQYGGRIIYQQLGPEPLDAYRQYLEERQAAGDFEIHRKDFREAFWRYFTTDSMHDFIEPGSEEEAGAFSIPSWSDNAAAPTTSRPAADDAGTPAGYNNGGPMNWEVTGVASGLHLRAQASTSGEILTTYQAGTILDNLGFGKAENRVWCYVQRFGGGPVGYVVADYLKPAVVPDGSVPVGPETTSPRAGKGQFDATGKIPCAQYAGQPTVQCDFGVARQSGGLATVVVTKPDGMKRAIFFRLGIPAGADTSQADGYGEFRYEKEGDLHLIRTGEERYEILDAVVTGG